MRLKLKRFTFSFSSLFFLLLSHTLRIIVRCNNLNYCTRSQSKHITKTRMMLSTEVASLCFSCAVALDKTDGNNSIVWVEICVDVDIYRWRFYVGTKGSGVMFSDKERGGQRWVQFVTKLKSTMVEVIKICLI